MKTLTFNAVPGVGLDFESKVQLFVNGKEVFKKASRQTTASYNIDATYTSGKISKDSIIRIEIRAHDSEYATVLEHQGTIESFVNDPILYGKGTGQLTVKSIAMEASWQNQ